MVKVHFLPSRLQRLSKPTVGKNTPLAKIEDNSQGNTDDAPVRGVLANGWVQSLGGTSIVALFALAAAFILHTEVKAAEIALAATAIPTLVIILAVKSRTPTDRESGRNKPIQFPERGDHHRSTFETRTNSDGSTTHESTVAGQIDRRPQMWEAISNKFKNLFDKPIPIWAEWIYTFETSRYEWWVRPPSENAVKLCIAVSAEAGRLLLAEPSFRKKFPDIAAITDDGDRWLLAIYKVAKIGKVTTNLSGSTRGIVSTGEGGEIKDLPGASQVLCQMALNGF